MPWRPHEPSLSEAEMLARCLWPNWIGCEGWAALVAFASAALDRLLRAGWTLEGPALLCDEIGCDHEATCGFPTPEGYRRTCGKHYEPVPSEPIPRLEAGVAHPVEP